MKQSRLGSLKESLWNTGIGFGISLIAQWLFLPVIGVPIVFWQNFVFAVFMTFVSVGRGYIVRRVAEWFGFKIPISVAAAAVLAERHRQVTGERFDTAHDDKHVDGELALAGVAYILNAVRPDRYVGRPPSFWPWELMWWKPQGFWRDMVRGCALIIAEMDRALRMRGKKLKTETGAAR